MVGGIYGLHGTLITDYAEWDATKLRIKFDLRDGLEEQIDMDALVVDLFTNLGIDTSQFTYNVTRDTINDIIIIEFSSLNSPNQHYDLIRAINSIKSNDSDPLIVGQASVDAAEQLVTDNEFLPIPTCTYAGTTWTFTFDLTTPQLADFLALLGVKADNLIQIVRDAIMLVYPSMDITDTTLYPYITYNYSAPNFTIDVNVGPSPTCYEKAKKAEIIYRITSRGLYSCPQWLYEAIDKL